MPGRRLGGACARAARRSGDGDGKDGAPAGGRRVPANAAHGSPARRAAPCVPHGGPGRMRRAGAAGACRLPGPACRMAGRGGCGRALRGGMPGGLRCRCRRRRHAGRQGAGRQKNRRIGQAAACDMQRPAAPLPLTGRAFPVRPWAAGRRGMPEVEGGEDNAAFAGPRAPQIAAGRPGRHARAAGAPPAALHAWPRRLPRGLPPGPVPSPPKPPGNAPALPARRPLFASRGMPPAFRCKIGHSSSPLDPCWA